MSVTLNGTSGLTFNDATTQNTSAFYGGLAFRNRIINGSMQIDQRNAGASVSTTSPYTQYTVDRWQAVFSQASKYTVQQNAGSVTPPTGFTNYLGVTSLSAYSSLSAGDFFYIRQQIEGYNVADLALGTANAATFTLSFWVRSSLTGTFGGTFSNADNNSIYPFTYTINSANTWEQKTITVAGRTSGTWNTTNGTGMSVLFALATGTTYSGTAGAWTSSLALGVTGQTNVLGTNGATFYITGVQLEKGSTATSFDYRPYGTELQLCMRYTQVYGGDNIPYQPYSNGVWVSSTLANLMMPFFQRFRASPTMTVTGGSNFFLRSGGGSATTSSVSTDLMTPDSCFIYANSSGGTAGNGTSLFQNSTNATKITFSAEL